MVEKFRPQLTHAGLNVYDLEKMRHFYAEVMGLMETDSGQAMRLKQNLAFLSGDPTKHHQIVLSTGRAPQSTVSTVNQISFKVPSLDALREMLRRVTAANCKNIYPVNHGNAWSVYFEDPEGNTLECYLDTPFYTSQPHGERLDLSLSDNEIVKATEMLCRKDPHFMLVEDWQEKMRKGLTQDGAKS